MSNVIRAGLNFISVLLLARSLASSGYGELMFLIGSFVSIKSLMDLGTANAFYTFISQGKNRSYHYFVYFSWLAIQFVLLGLFIIVICPPKLLDIIWLGHSRYLILLAFIASFLQQQGWQTINQIGESERKTIWNQIFGVIIALVNVLGILLLRIFNNLTIPNILIFYILEYVIFCVVTFFVLGADQYLFPLKKDNVLVRTIVWEYFRYCYPLIVTTLVGFLYSYTDTWMLQYFGGSAEQGLFQIANQFATIVLLATSSVLNIFWKEIAVAYEKKDKIKVQQIYFKAMRGLFMFGAVISGFLIPWTNEIILLFLGEKYINVAPILAIMFFYPIHQSMGQLAGAFFLSTNQTRIYSVTSIATMLISIPITYLIQSPVDGYPVPGLGLGAFGLSIKIVILNIVSVNVCVYIISRLQRWQYDYQHQLYAIVLTSILGYASYLGARSVGGIFFISSLKITVLLQGVIAAIIYFSGILFIIYYIPALVGFSHIEIHKITQRVKMLIKNVFLGMK